MSEGIDAELRAWAVSRSDVRAAILIGSRARSDPPADEWSDVDVVVVVDDVAAFTDDDDWLGHFGDLLTASFTQSGEHYFEREALYAGGQKIDFLLVPAPDLDRFPETGFEPGLASVMRRGARVLLGEEEVGPLVERARRAASDLPDRRTFERAVGLFLVDCVNAARKLRRGELWAARRYLEEWLRPQLRTMLEWRAQAADPSAPVWPAGRFMERWVDPTTLEALGRTVAGIDAEELHAALTEAMELFVSLARDCAVRLGFSFPDRAAAEVSGLIEDLRPVT